MKANSRMRTLVRELRLAPDERRAARAERRVEDEMRRQRDNPESADRRRAALEAESRRAQAHRGR